MQETLERLNQTPGIQGSFVVGEDGMIVQADMAAAMEEETVGALASSIANTVERASAHLDQGPLVSVALESENSKLLFCPTRVGYLVTLASNRANLGLVRFEMNAAVKRLNQRARDNLSG